MYDEKSTLNFISNVHKPPVSNRSSMPSGKTFMKRGRKKETGRGSIWDGKQTACSDLRKVMESELVHSFMHTSPEKRHISDTVCCQKDMSQRN